MFVPGDPGVVVHCPNHSVTVHFMEKNMRKSIVWSMTVLAVLVSACGKDDTKSEGTKATDTSAATASPSESSTRTTASEAPAGSFKRYGIESGVIEYTLSGAQNGTQTVYFDKWGAREAKYTDATISFGGTSRKMHTLMLIRNDSVYSVDLDTKTGTAMRNPLLDGTMSNGKGKDLMEMGMDMMKQMGGEKVGTEEILGRSCDVWKIKNLGSKACIWNAVPMKTEVDMMGMKQSNVAVKLDENASIPEEKFRVPTDVKLTQGADMEKMMKNMPNMNGMKKMPGMGEMQKLMK